MSLRVTMMKHSNILACPFCIIVPSHYRADGSCKCDDPQEQAMMIKEWGYTKKSFAKINNKKEVGAKRPS